MQALALQCLFGACCSAPFVVAARRSGLRRSQGRVAWWGVALLAAALSATADPLAIALARVDGALAQPSCGP